MLQKFLTKRQGLMIIFIIFLVWLTFDVIGPGGNIRFYSKWVECGNKPVATAGSGFLGAGARSYFVPSNVALIQPSIDYFCTPLQAEQAGYSASPTQYTFPHLKDGVGDAQ